MPTSIVYGKILQKTYTVGNHAPWFEFGGARPYIVNPDPVLCDHTVFKAYHEIEQTQHLSFNLQVGDSIYVNDDHRKIEVKSQRLDGVMLYYLDYVIDTVEDFEARATAELDIQRYHENFQQQILGHLQIETEIRQQRERDLDHYEIPDPLPRRPFGQRILDWMERKKK